MQSINFEFLRPKWPQLAGLGGFAESYAHSDPVGAIAKLRIYCEQVVEWLTSELRLPKPPRATLIELLDNPSFRDVVPPVVVTKLHALRIEGNRSLHGNTGNTTAALRLLQDAWNIGRWLHLTYANGSVEDCPQFQDPPQGGVTAQIQRREKRAILERVAAQEAQMQRLLADLEAARQQADQAQATASELEAALAAGRRSAATLEAIDPLAFSEAETRRYLIDVMLATAGWQVAPDLGNTAQVRKEVAVGHQPTESGTGYIDYVLYDETNGRPLAVVEAKKTARTAEEGRTQAQLYADGLMRDLHLAPHERPVLFYTNGHDLWLWNDAEQEPPRRVYGFPSPDSLAYLHHQRTQRKPLAEVAPSTAIIDRSYQIEAVRRVVERFAEKKRKALIVQATGTGKTRVAIALCEALFRAGWAKRVLFLCDRLELRKQAHKAFKEFLPADPRTYITPQTDTNARIFLGTYPAMMKCFENFDTGFFDLIIADESHRSLYRRYKVIFDYFDAYQVGLTATPINEQTINAFFRNTFRMFGCDDLNPTFNFDYAEAVRRKYLTPFVVDTHTTQFLRNGIKASELSADQRQRLEEDGEDPSLFQYEAGQIDRVVFNKDTNRHILRNLMERGIRVADGTRLGKTIIFARSHDHAVLLQHLFDEMYPQFGGEFCRVIDTYDSRADELIDEFKGEGRPSNLTIAISVDMLDTGIDVPEIVNLVFAKPVFSYVKFWQMIGRGTRLCPNLFGPGQDKTQFQIFDHWGNFERWEQGFQPAEPTRSKSLVETVFLARLELAETALETQQAEAFDLAVGLIGQDLASLPEKSLPIREKWKPLTEVRRPETLRRFDAATRATLHHEIAPLMEWVNIAGHVEAWRFDRLIARLQGELLRGSSRFDDLRNELLDLVGELRINLTQVRAKLAVIERVKGNAFWQAVTVADLEQIRQELRGIIQYRDSTGAGPARPKTVDIREDESQIQTARRPVRIAGLEMVAYRQRVQQALQAIIDQNETLQKIRQGQAVAPAELEALCSLVLTHDPQLDLHDLVEYHRVAPDLYRAIRGIIGLEGDLVERRFSEFVRAHPNLASHQIQFLDLLQAHIARYGSIELETLYEAPFTLLHSDSLDGLFDERLAEELLEILEDFRAGSG